MFTAELHGINRVLDAMSANTMVAGATLNIVHTNPVARGCCRGRIVERSTLDRRTSRRSNWLGRGAHYFLPFNGRLIGSILA